MKGDSWLDCLSQQEREYKTATDISTSLVFQSSQIIPVPLEQYLHPQTSINSLLIMPSTNGSTIYKLAVARDTVLEMSRASSYYHSLVTSGANDEKLQEAKDVLDVARMWFHAANTETARSVRISVPVSMS